MRIALEVFAQNGYLGTSMNDNAGQLGFTKAALYKHYSSKQEILDKIVERMNRMDYERAAEYEMPETEPDGFAEALKLCNKHGESQVMIDEIYPYNKRKRQITGDEMLIEIDFNSNEAIYVQLQNQIIMGIATSVIHEGDSLPSVRRLADTIGVNMHTVNKAYSVLKREGYISLDKRRGAVISLDIDKLEELQVMKRQLQIVLARGCCKNISRQEVHELVDEIFDDYE